MGDCKNEEHLFGIIRSEEKERGNDKIFESRAWNEIFRNLHWRKMRRKVRKRNSIRRNDIHICNLLWMNKIGCSEQFTLWFCDENPKQLRQHTKGIWFENWSNTSSTNWWSVCVCFPWIVQMPLLCPNFIYFQKFHSYILWNHGESMDASSSRCKSNHFTWYRSKR